MNGRKSQIIQENSVDSRFKLINFMIQVRDRGYAHLIVFVVECMSPVPSPTPLPHAATSALSSSPIFLPPHIRILVWFLREPASYMSAAAMLVYIINVCNPFILQFILNKGAPQKTTFQRKDTKESEVQKMEDIGGDIEVKMWES